MTERRNGRIWLFDYDLTLYAHTERAVLDSLDLRISQYVERVVGCSFEDAQRIRKDYLKRFGTTLSGLRSVYGVSPDDFFDFIHNPEFLTYPSPATGKKLLLESLDGPKYIFTNGRSDWSRAGVSRMGVLDCFHRIVGLENLDWDGKPQNSAYEKMEAVLEADGVFRRGESRRRLVLLDDSAANLLTAKVRGWTTVWVNPSTEPVSFSPDFRISTLMELPTILDKILFD